MSEDLNQTEPLPQLEELEQQMAGGQLAHAVERRLAWSMDDLPSETAEAEYLALPTEEDVHKSIQEISMRNPARFAVLYADGDPQVHRLVNQISRMPMTALPTSRALHTYAVTALESVHGDALSWHSQTANEKTAVAAYARNPMLPFAYFDVRYSDYIRDSKRIRSDQFQSPQEAAQRSDERLLRMERDFQHAIGRALEIAGPNDPLVPIVDAYRLGDRQSFGFEIIDGHKVPTTSYDRSACHYLKNVCELGRENVAKINEATGIVNFDRYSTGQLDLARRFADRDQETIDELNKAGAQWRVAGKGGDWTDDTADTRHIATTHLLPFEVGRGRNESFGFVRNSLKDHGVDKITFGIFAFHGLPGGFTVTGHDIVTTLEEADLTGNLHQKLADSTAIGGLLETITPDDEGYRNAALLMCSSATFVPGRGSVAEVVTGMLPMMRVMAADGIAFSRITDDGGWYMDVTADPESGHGDPGLRQLISDQFSLWGAAADVTIGPTIFTSDKYPEREQSATLPWRSSKYRHYPTSRQQAQSNKFAVPLAEERYAVYA